MILNHFTLAPPPPLSLFLPTLPQQVRRSREPTSADVEIDVYGAGSRRRKIGLVLDSETLGTILPWTMIIGICAPPWTMSSKETPLPPPAKPSPIWPETLANADTIIALVELITGEQEIHDQRRTDQWRRQRERKSSLRVGTTARAVIIEFFHEKSMDVFHDN